MTQAQLDELKKTHTEIEVLENETNRNMRKLWDKIRAIEQVCDHTNPDGSSAIKELLPSTFCSICGHDC